MSKRLLSVLIFLMVFSVFHSHAMDPLVDFQTLECAVNLVSEENRSFISETAIDMFRSSIILLGRLSRRSRHEIPLAPSTPAFNSIRISLNNGILTEEIRYVSLPIKDSDGNEYLTYGKIKGIESFLPKRNTKNIKFYIELLDGEEVTLTGSDLYGIAVSEKSRHAFEQKKSGGHIPSIPKIRIGEGVIFSESDGALRYGKIERFVGDEVDIYLTDTDKDKKRLVSIESISFLLQLTSQVQVEDEILVQIEMDDAEIEFLSRDNLNMSFPGAQFIRDTEVFHPQNDGHHNRVFFATVKSINDDGTLQVKMIKNKMLLYRQIHPRQIIGNPRSIYDLLNTFL